MKVSPAWKLQVAADISGHLTRNPPPFCLWLPAYADEKQPFLAFVPTYLIPTPLNVVFMFL